MKMMCPMGGHFFTKDLLLMEVKKPKTYEEQVSIIENKGFIVANRTECINFLHQANYYRLSAYFLPFRQEDKTYLPGIPMKRIQRIYEFDQRLRALLFEAIQEIELYLRTQFAYYSGHKYGPLGYLDSSNFSQRHDSFSFTQKIQQCINENQRTLVVAHHQAKYEGKFPIWVIIEFFSVGMLSYFYSDLLSQDQKALAKEMYQTAPVCLKSWLRCLTDLRNRCAHYSRLYFWNFAAIPQIPKKVNLQADRTLFSQIFTLKFLYPNALKWNSRILAELEAIMEEFHEDISLSHIGFPSNWLTLLTA